MLSPAIAVRDFFLSRVSPQGLPLMPFSLVSHESLFSCLCAIVFICILLITSLFYKAWQSLLFTPLHRPVSGWMLLRRNSYNTYNLSALFNKQKARTVDRRGTFKCGQMKFMYERKREWKIVLCGMKLHPVFIELFVLPQKDVCSGVSATILIQDNIYFTFSN